MAPVYLSARRLCDLSRLLQFALSVLSVRLASVHSSNCSGPPRLQIRQRRVNCLNLRQLEYVSPDLNSLPQSL
ncbi:hypothetical protein AMELA_G00071080 [Ameiurus melas]|uniref:Uncharacterized protein n=1 Tax=Ameiurus melas TaxID=219545 RepID=A0A7J6AX89_AMEME|nr:hypothetical protein AMELA_G00071080 [Ameiurus melas]